MLPSLKSHEVVGKGFFQGWGIDLIEHFPYLGIPGDGLYLKEGLHIARLFCFFHPFLKL